MQHAQGGRVAAGRHSYAQLQALGWPCCRCCRRRARAGWPTPYLQSARRRACRRRRMRRRTETCMHTTRRLHCRSKCSHAVVSLVARSAASCPGLSISCIYARACYKRSIGPSTYSKHCGINKAFPWCRPHQQPSMVSALGGSLAAHIPSISLMHHACGPFRRRAPAHSAGHAQHVVLGKNQLQGSSNSINK